MKAEWVPVVHGLKIAIDGPSGSGKGTVAAMLAEAIGFPVLDTGLLYRFIARMAMDRNMDVGDEDALAGLVQEVITNMEWRPEGIFYRGENQAPRLRSEEVGAAASKVAAHPQVRRQLLAVQRQVAEKGCVMDGRDIGTVVLPDAQAKFYLTASLRERSRRRWAQLHSEQPEVSLERIVADLKARDQRDAERAHSPLQKAQDAIHIDSTTMRVDEVLDRMLAVLARRGLIRYAG
ncbi:MAG: (d)CMP kinase [Mariprofundaceae bacterium]|nr:(d)CMP kinase [Mariprofundaceae bacterium]